MPHNKQWYSQDLLNTNQMCY